jgi:predicted lipoprotein
VTRTLVLLALAGLTACSGAAGGGDPAGDRGAAVAAVVDEVVVPAHADLAATTAGLAEQTEALCAEPSAEHLTATRDAWRAAMSSRAAERPVALGPAMERTSMAELDWLADPEGIAEVLAEGAAVTTETVGNGPAGGKGLLAVEHLLFGDGSDALADDDRVRCAYAQAATALVAREGQRLHAEFTGGTADRLAGRGAVRVTPDGVIGELVNEQVHVLDELTDNRLAADAAAETAEGPAGHGVAMTRAALGTIEQTYTPERLGGQLPDEIAERLTTSLTAAAAVLDESRGALGDMPADTRDRLHRAVDRVRVAVRTDVVSALDVVLGFSDNDGDSG